MSHLSFSFAFLIKAWSFYAYLIVQVLIIIPKRIYQKTKNNYPKTFHVKDTNLLFSNFCLICVSCFPFQFIWKYVRVSFLLVSLMQSVCLLIWAFVRSYSYVCFLLMESCQCSEILNRMQEYTLYLVNVVRSLSAEPCGSSICFKWYSFYTGTNIK